MIHKVGDGKIKDPSDEDEKYKNLSVSCNFSSCKQDEFGSQLIHKSNHDKRS